MYSARDQPVACGSPLIKSASSPNLWLLQVTWLYGIQLTGLLLVCILQFFNSMILGSLLISFNLSVLIARKLQVGLFCFVLKLLKKHVVVFHIGYKGKFMTKLPLNHSRGIIIIIIFFF